MTDTTETDEPVDVALDFDGPFTLNEIILVEIWSGVPMPQWFNGERPEGELRRAITCVKARRAFPDFTLVDAGDFPYLATED